MHPWYVVFVAVLGTGCEQLKSPKRIAELEGRVKELADDIAALKVGAAKPTSEGDAGGSAAEHRPGPGPEDAGHAEGHEGHAATVEPEPDAGTPSARSDDPMERIDDPMERIKEVVAQNTGVRPGAAKPGDGQHDAPHWSYQGKTAPAAWGALHPTWDACSSGMQQSPIDIEPRAGTATPIKFHYQATPATIVDNGRTLQVNLAAGSSIEIDGRSYQLVQFHFHTPSEHTIAGEHYPLELHLVHKAADGKLAVVGVLYDAGMESKPLDGVWSKWPGKSGTENKLRKPFDPSLLLPETRTVFRYAGSLTTPPCTEGVVWNVMRRTLTDSRRHLELIAQHYALNARAPQPLHDRKVE